MAKKSPTVGVDEVSTRRESLRLFGLAGIAVVAGCGSSTATSGPSAKSAEGGASPSGEGAQPSCILRPEQTEGPYFLDGRLNRSDVRSNPADGAVVPGAPLRLAFRVGRVNGTSCAPLAGAAVDLWQCDSVGVYSGFRDIGGHFDTTGQQFLRGFQITGTDGTCQFLTIYPGWYPGRSVHIHFKIRATAGGRTFSLTSQLYFPETLTEQVFARAPYTNHAGRRTQNVDDGIFQQGGSDLMLAPVSDGEGYAAIFDVGLQLG
jgi:protocatechuate 3,4-dioxygenase beta subunit